MAEREFRDKVDVVLLAVDDSLNRRGYELSMEVLDQQTFEIARTYKGDNGAVVVSYDPAYMDNVKVIGNDLVLSEVESKVKLLTDLKLA